MQFIDLLKPDQVLVDRDLSSKKRVLMEVSKLMAEEDADISARDVFQSLCAREQIGSTTLGSGIAIPHGQLETPRGFASGALLRLNHPVDFDAADRQGVDLVFAVVTSAEIASQQMELLSMLDDMLSDSEFVRSMREARDDAALFDLVTSWQQNLASA